VDDIFVEARDSYPLTHYIDSELIILCSYFLILSGSGEATNTNFIDWGSNS